MVMIIRVSTLFAVVVIAAKAGIFVADDASLFKNRALEPVEKKVGRLIDEAMRRRSEIEEAADGVADMAQAVAVSVVRAIVRVVGGAVCRVARSKGAVARSSGGVARWTATAFRSALVGMAGKPLFQDVEAHHAVA